jgi:hypothetical protein
VRDDCQPIPYNINDNMEVTNEKSSQFDPDVPQSSDSSALVAISGDTPGEVMGGLSTMGEKPGVSRRFLWRRTSVEVYLHHDEVVEGDLKI